MMKYLLLICFVFSLSFLASAENPKQNLKSCLSVGESGSVGGVPGKNGWKLNPKCCQGLKDRESLAVCGTPYGGGYVYACLQCGDKICDSKFESHCNCPEDCKK